MTTGISVTLASDTPEAKIFYTLDETQPSAESTPYSGPVSIQTEESSKTLKAIATKEGFDDSEVLEITYTNSEFAAIFFDEQPKAVKTTRKK